MINWLNKLCVREFEVMNPWAKNPEDPREDWSSSEIKDKIDLGTAWQRVEATESPKLPIDIYVKRLWRVDEFPRNFRRLTWIGRRILSLVRPLIYWKNKRFLFPTTCFRWNNTKESFEQLRTCPDTSQKLPANCRLTINLINSSLKSSTEWKPKANEHPQPARLLESIQCNRTGFLITPAAHDIITDALLHWATSYNMTRSNQSVWLLYTLDCWLTAFYRYFWIPRLQRFDKQHKTLAQNVHNIHAFVRPLTRSRTFINPPPQRRNIFRSRRLRTPSPQPLPMSKRQWTLSPSPAQQQILKTCRQTYSLEFPNLNQLLIHIIVDLDRQTTNF